MAAVDVDAIDAQMKMAALDTTDYVPKSSAGGYQVLREPAWNKGISCPSLKILAAT
jgi:malate dehydrogenase (oxaloacetate-decarboxylating)(NADP+)